MAETPKINTSDKQSIVTTVGEKATHQLFDLASFEIAGGDYDLPMAAGSWIYTTGDFYVYGIVIGAANADISAVKYESDDTIESLSYLGCIANHFYRFPGGLIKEITFSGAVTLCFRRKIEL